MKDDCIFCKLANGVLETNTFYEDENFRVIFDISPATEGHLIILPKEHYANVFELPDDVASEVYVLAKKVAATLKEITGCAGVNILQNNGEVAGQTVFHFHMHIIPRYGEEILKWTAGKLDDEMVEDVISKAKQIL